MKADDIVVNLIALHGGELVGRTRLQKVAYLLHRCGGNFALSFVYHYYGPYSFDLADGCTDARAEGRIEIEERPGRYGIQYAVFRTGEKNGTPVGMGNLALDRAHELVEKMTKVSDIVLELAATIVFFRDEGGYLDRNKAIAETKVRKPIKATDERVARARALLDTLELDALDALEVIAP